jgi:hypothetical protein
MRDLRNSFTPVNTLRHRTTFLSQTIAVSERSITSPYTVVLFNAYLPGCAVLNASLTATNEFKAKYRKGKGMRSEMQWSHQHSVCATDVSSDLATRVTLT